MNAPLHRAELGFLGRYEGLRDRLPGDAAAREAAAAAFRDAGLPTMRDEAWRYTNLRALAEGAFSEPLVSLDDCGALLARVPPAEGGRIVFVDGRFRDDLSALPDGAPVGRFATAPRFGARARPEAQPLVALNTMLAEDGVVLDVPANVDAGTLQLASLATDLHGRPITFHPRHRVRLAEGAKLTLFEISLGEGSYLHNPVAEIEVGSGARLVHVRLQEESDAAWHLATIYAEVAGGGEYDAFTLTTGGRVVRTEFRARLTGPDGAVHLNGAQLLAGRQVADFTSVVSHDAPRCASRQTVKNVLAGRSRGVFQSRIEVARVAQKTDGYQMNQALLLSPEAEIDSKPELEIFADDVKCSHGATVGELDPDQLFYLRARGIPEAEARSMLVRAFLAEALDLVAAEDVRAALEQRVSGWWERQQA
jgi:Fe-S cluster assembly protein SufD